MMDMVEAIRGIAQEELRNFRMPELGIVTSIFPHSSDSDKDNYECNVRLKEPDLELRRVPIATQVIGLAGIPRVGDLVLVLYVNGDVNSPVIVGRLYNDEDRPPANKAEEIVYVAPYSTNPDVRRVYLEFPSGLTLQMTDDDVKLKAGATRVTISRNGNVTVESKADVTIAAKGDASIKADGEMNISGATVNIKSEQDMRIESGSNLIAKTEMNTILESGNVAQLKSNVTTMESQDATIIQAASLVEMKSKSNLVLSAGANLQASSDGNAVLKANGSTTIKGAQVSIN